MVVLCRCGCGGSPSTRGRNYCLGHNPGSHSPEVARHPARLAAISLAMKDRWAAEGYRKGFAKKMWGRKITWADKISASIKALNRDGTSYASKRRRIHRSRAFRHKIAEYTADRNRSSCKPNGVELHLFGILKRHFPDEFKLNVRNGVRLGTLVPDYVGASSKKIVLEMFGSYWHGEKKTGRTKKQEERKRKSAFARLGYRCVIVWENELADERKLVARLGKLL